MISRFYEKLATRNSAPSSQVRPIACTETGDPSRLCPRGRGFAERMVMVPGKAL
jgi:hypothetical protein